jgi:hypothetical protein
MEAERATCHSELYRPPRRMESAREAAVSQRPPGPTLTPGDIVEYLETADDFAFEREVYDVAHKLGFKAEHAALYSDPVTGKQREFDVRASCRTEVRTILKIKGPKANFMLIPIQCSAPRGTE